jgi:hypothetical protein
MSFLAFGFLLILTGALVVLLYLVVCDVRACGRVRTNELHYLIPFSLFCGVLGAAPFLVAYCVFLKVV